MNENCPQVGSTKGTQIHKNLRLTGDNKSLLELMSSDPIAGNNMSSFDFIDMMPSEQPSRPLNVLQFKPKNENHAPPQMPFFHNLEEEDILSVPYQQQRKIQKTPFKVLDAPALQDDYYLNLVDWSSENVLAVGLGSCVYLWSASTSKVTKLYDLGPQD